MVISYHSFGFVTNTKYKKIVLEICLVLVRLWKTLCFSFHFLRLCEFTNATNWTSLSRGWFRHKLISLCLNWCVIRRWGHLKNNNHLPWHHYQLQNTVDLPQDPQEKALVNYSFKPPWYRHHWSLLSPMKLYISISVGCFIYDRFFGLPIVMVSSLEFASFWKREIIFITLCECKKNKSSCGFVLFYITGKPHEDRDALLYTYVEWYAPFDLKKNTVLVLFCKALYDFPFSQWYIYKVNSTVIQMYHFYFTCEESVMYHQLVGM